MTQDHGTYNIRKMSLNIELVEFTNVGREGDGGDV